MLFFVHKKIYDKINIIIIYCNCEIKCAYEDFIYDTL